MYLAVVSLSAVSNHAPADDRRRFGIQLGDVVLFRSDYSDKYYRPLPNGRRYIAEILDGQAPGYPDPDPTCMELLATRNVMTLGTDSASMGPLPNLAEPTHYAGLKHGMIWTEGATDLGALPPTGGFYCMLGPKHEAGPYSEGRAFSIVGGSLPNRLIDSCRNKRAIDLSPTMSPGLPLTSPGIGTGEHRQVYLKIDFLYSEYLDMWHHGHLMDAMAGTHLVPPSFALPADDKPVPYPGEIRGWLEEYQAEFGRRGSSTMTTEQVPLSWTCGEARVIDATSLVGSTRLQDWPLSPEITVDHLQAFEQTHGELTAGDIVIFHTEHNDRYLRPGLANTALWLDPLSGKSEGWPAPGPATIDYLKTKGIRSIAAVKIRDCHGGPGRAIVLY